MNLGRFGLIGFGAWGVHHARAIAGDSNAHLTAIATRSDSSQKAAGKAHPSASIGGGNLPDLPISKITGEVFELEDQVALLVASVRNGAPLCATGEDGRWSVAMCLKAAESVKAGRIVQF